MADSIEIMRATIQGGRYLKMFGYYNVQEANGSRVPVAKVSESPAFMKAVTDPGVPGGCAAGGGVGEES
jgi:hypothetical protein